MAKKKAQPVQDRKTLKDRLRIVIESELPVCPFVAPASFALSTVSKDRRIEKGGSRKRKHKGKSDSSSDSSS